MDHFEKRRSGILGLYDTVSRLPRPVLAAGACCFIVLASLPLLGVANYTTTNPSFCLSCHATGETPDMSRRSLVHPGYDKVKCVDCHAKPGQVLIAEGYRGGFKAEPERVSPNCLRCHQNMITDEQVDFKFNVNNVRIPHRFHIDTVGAYCTDCHRNIAHDFGEPQTNRPRMSYCMQCHQPTDTCMKCHPAGIPNPAKT